MTLYGLLCLCLPYAPIMSHKRYTQVGKITYFTPMTLILICYKADAWKIEKKKQYKKEDKKGTIDRPYNK